MGSVCSVQMCDHLGHAAGCTAVSIVRQQTLTSCIKCSEGPAINSALLHLLPCWAHWRHMHTHMDFLLPLSVSKLDKASEAFNEDTDNTYNIQVLVTVTARIIQ